MRLHHLALRTTNVDALERFYVGVLGLAITTRSERSIWLDAGGTILMLERAAPGEPPPAPGTMELTCFEIPATERDAARRRLAAAGIGIEAETEFTMYFRDPDGRRIGLSHFEFTGAR